MGVHTGKHACICKCIGDIPSWTTREEVKKRELCQRGRGKSAASRAGSYCKRAECSMTEIY